MKMFRKEVLFLIGVVLFLTLPLMAGTVRSEAIATGDALQITVEDMQPHTWYVLYQRNTDESWSYLDFLISSVELTRSFTTKPTRAGNYGVFKFKAESFNPTDPPSNPNSGINSWSNFLIENK